ncbi:MAG: biotin--[acetyl-CoA-carboxylase] ligase [Clostridia bacterium]|nr:biotin--[acetyl-CoA-carboxylase] ligase [Clostridia bacterium]
MIINIPNYNSPLTVEKRKKVTSTNDILKEYALNGLDNYVLIANEQTGGRGRYNRYYYSPKDSGIYFSILLRPNIDRSIYPLITPICAVAVCEAINEYGIDASIKWVNDIIVKDKKVCGILVETIISDNPAIVIGIGLNLFPPKKGFPEDIKDKAGSIFDTKKNVKNVIVQKVINNFFKYYTNLNSKDYVTYYKDHCKTVGEKVKVIDVNGNEKDCIAKELTDNLELVIENLDGSTEIIRTGEATIIPQ